MRKIIAIFISVSIILTGCASNVTISSDVSDVVSTIIEYPQGSSDIISSSNISSNQSSEIDSSVLSSATSSAVSSTVSKNTTSQKPVSQKPKPKPKPTSSKPKPTSSKPKPPSSVAPPVTPSDNNDMRAVWISYLEFLSFKGSSQAKFTNTIRQYFDNAKSKGLNAVIVQVRPFGDSFYESDYYPWSKYISGVVGEAVSYDPLSIMVNEAKNLSLQIHAWVNPYRTMTDTEFQSVDSKYPVKQWYDSPNRDEYMIKISDRWWLKPGNSQVQQLIIDGTKEIVSKYNVDGIHIDDYFYNTSVTAYGDTKAQAKDNTTALVKGLYNGIKSVNSSVQFGVSPAGGFKADNNAPTSDLSDHSTDLVTWCSNYGYIDYVMPQIYWDYDNPYSPFAQVFQKWESLVTSSSVKLYIGLGPYQVPKASIDKQISDISNSVKATGYALYRYANI